MTDEPICLYCDDNDMCMKNGGPCIDNDEILPSCFLHKNNLCEHMGYAKTNIGQRFLCHKYKRTVPKPCKKTGPCYVETNIHTNKKCIIDGTDLSYDISTSKYKGPRKEKGKICKNLEMINDNGDLMYKCGIGEYTGTYKKPCTVDNHLGCLKYISAVALNNHKNKFPVFQTTPEIFCEMQKHDKNDDHFYCNVYPWRRSSQPCTKTECYECSKFKTKHPLKKKEEPMINDKIETIDLTVKIGEKDGYNACTNCNLEVPADALYCRGCGEEIGIIGLADTVVHPFNTKWIGKPKKKVVEEWISHPQLRMPDFKLQKYDANNPDMLKRTIIEKTCINCDHYDRSWKGQDHLNDIMRKIKYDANHNILWEADCLKYQYNVGAKIKMISSSATTNKFPVCNGWKALAIVEKKPNWFKRLWKKIDSIGLMALVCISIGAFCMIYALFNM